MTKLKILLGCFAFLLFMTLVLNDHMHKFNTDQFVYYSTIRISVLIVISILWIPLLKFKPDWYVFIPPVFITICGYGIANCATMSKEVSMHEYVLPNLSFCFLMVIIVPNYGNYNSLAFALMMVYTLYKVKLKYGFISEGFYMAVLAVVIYYVMSCVILDSKFKYLHRVILQNIKLAKETKMLLKVFPSGVIIHSGFESSKQETVFSNQKFESQICEIRHRVDEFDAVEVSFRSNEDGETIRTSLQELLIDHQNKLENSHVTEQNRVVIKSTSEIDDFEKRIFTVKSLVASWDNQDCFMHVFIDNTNIIKLEEANTNIR